MKKTLYVALFIKIFINLNAQIVNLPDTNFKNALLSHYPAIDTNENGEIEVSEAEGFAEKINVSSKSINDLTGIEAFTNATILSCSNNNLTSLDVSNNSKLIELICHNNMLDELDISQNTLLQKLFCYSNNLTELNTSYNPDLLSISCGNNLMNQLDVSQNIALIDLFCAKNNLSNLDVSNNDSLTQLQCEGNLLTNIDLSQNENLEYLWCAFNSLTTLDISNNLNLAVLSCENNYLTNLDVSNNLLLEDLTCLMNNFTSFDITNNTKLQSFRVSTFRPFEINLSNNTSLINLMLMGDFKNIDVSNNLALEYLTIYSNDSLTSLNISNNTYLIDLLCTQTQVSYINFTKNLALQTIYCNHNNLAHMDLSANTQLSSLNCSNNNLSSLNLSANSLLQFIDCSNNDLISLNLRNGNNHGLTSLNSFFLVGEDSFSLANNPNLTCIEVDDPEHSAEYWQDHIDTQMYFSSNCVEFKGIISGDFYWDENLNSVYDFTEKKLPFSGVFVYPDSVMGLSNLDGTYTIYLDSGAHTITPDSFSCWTLTSDSPVYHVTIDTADISGLDFGFSPSKSITLGVINIYSSIARCNQATEATIDLTNIGATKINGKLKVPSPTLVDSFIAASPPPDTIVNDTLCWNVESLYPFEHQQISIEYQMPGVDSIGSTFFIEPYLVIPKSLENGHDVINIEIDTNIATAHICHCTGNTDIPYVVIEVPYAYIDGHGNNDHSNHLCDIIPIEDINLDGRIDTADCTANGTSYSNLIIKGTYLDEFRCAYDPNDKQSNPSGFGENNLTLFSQDLVYTVRFQNTGNDTAFSVKIRDTISEYLDVQTFRIASSSHLNLLQTTIKNEREISFLFENILLPDSGVDMLGSQGFVSYSIKPKTNLDENTTIENTAHIYFDFNPAIITNTTVNTIVSAIYIGSNNDITICDGENYILPNNKIISEAGSYVDTIEAYAFHTVLTTDLTVSANYDNSIIDSISLGESYVLPNGTVVSDTGVYIITFSTSDGCDSTITAKLGLINELSNIVAIKSLELFKLYPNPAKDVFYVENQGAHEEMYIYSVYNSLGNKVHQVSSSNSVVEIATNTWANGLFMIEIRDTNGNQVGLEKIMVR